MRRCVNVIPTSQLRSPRSGSFRSASDASRTDASTSRIAGRLGPRIIRLVAFLIFDIVTYVTTQRAGCTDSGRSYAPGTSRIRSENDKVKR